MPGQKASEALRREQILVAAHDVALRAGIDGVTVRAVAARARVSHGLVLFHFRRKEQLVSALLDRVLANTLSLRVPDKVALIEDPRERLVALLRQEVDRLSRNAAQVRLFLEYWALGARQKAVGEKINAELRSYREVLRTLAAEMLPANPTTGVGGTPEGLAAMGASLIHGCALQAMIDPAHFDLEEHVTAFEGLLGPSPPKSARRRSGPGSMLGSGGRGAAAGRPG
jgi:TetR/AcrR family transcriptional regulator, transcriptional repressor of bet genes